jgi:hypothetical protein
MYTHVSKCKNNKIKGEKNLKKGIVYHDEEKQVIKCSTHS